jgi:small redox-active disulfide protein 2
MELKGYDDRTCPPQFCQFPQFPQFLENRLKKGDRTMEVKILGTGCPKCKRLEQLAREAAEEAGVEAVFTKVTDMEGIMAYPIVSTPGLVIDEQLRSSGRLPRKEEIVTWLKEAQG